MAWDLVKSGAAVGCRLILAQLYRDEALPWEGGGPWNTLRNLGTSTRKMSWIVALRSSTVREQWISVRSLSARGCQMGMRERGQVRERVSGLG